jgi:hypothetical protein
MWSRDHFLDLHSFDSIAKLFSIFRISITAHKPRSRIFWKGLNHLLRRPGSGWMIRHIEMNDLSSAM